MITPKYQTMDHNGFVEINWYLKIIEIINIFMGWESKFWTVKFYNSWRLEFEN